MDCYFCGKKFTKKQNLNRHINIAHLDLKKYYCEICDKKFGRKAHLDHHIKCKHS